MTLKEGIKQRLASKSLYATERDIQRAIWRNEKAYQRSMTFRKGGGDQYRTIEINCSYLEVNRMAQRIKK